MLRCAKCGEELPSIKCSSCGNMTLNMGEHCIHCGEKLFKSVDDENGDEFDFENRVLCSDGTCTGIIVDGKCTECGKPQQAGDN